MMPRIKRWFPVSHEINRDEELWALEKKYGPRVVRMWLEILSIADRNDGVIPGSFDTLVHHLKWQIRSHEVPTKLALSGIFSAGWLELSDGIRVANYWKYHKTPEQKTVPSEPDQTDPDLIKKKKEDNTCHLAAVPPKWPHAELLIKKYNDETPEQLPAVEKITPARLKKAREYLRIFPQELFWTEAFQEISKSDFLLGRKNGTGHETFKANFDWLLSKGKDGTENIVKVFEGRYRNGR